MSQVFPRHDQVMQIIHNQHRTEDMTVSAYIAAFNLEDGFQDPKAMIPECVKTDSLWTVSWYRGAVHVETCGSTFEQAMSYSLEIDAGLE